MKNTLFISMIISSALLSDAAGMESSKTMPVIEKRPRRIVIDSDDEEYADFVAESQKKQKTTEFNKKDQEEAGSLEKIERQNRDTFLKKFEAAPTENDALNMLIQKDPLDAGNKMMYNEALIEASRKGYLTIVQLLYKNGADIHYKPLIGWPAFFNAAYYCHCDIMEFLLSKGVNINRTIAGRTALTQAILSGKIQSVKFLIDHGADIHARDRDNKTTLMIAVEKGNLEMVKLFHNLGVPINQRTKYGYTELMLAACTKYLNIARYLVKAGADITAENRKKRTAYGLAIQRGRRLIADFLEGLEDKVSKEQPSIQKPISPELSHELTPPVAVADVLYRCAAKCGLSEPLQQLTPPVLLKDIIHKRAAKSVLPEPVRQLTPPVLLQDIINKCRLKPVLPEPLQQIAPPQQLEELLPHGEESTIMENDTRKTLLHDALAENNYTTAEMLIAEKSLINIPNEQKQTPLMLITQKANADRVWLNLLDALHSAQADIEARDKEGNIFLDYADDELLPELSRWTKKYRHLMKGKSL